MTKLKLNKFKESGINLNLTNRLFLFPTSKGILGALFLSVAFLLSNTSCEQRDPQAEYEQLRETVYSSPREGEEVAQEYIDYFYNKKGARVNEVSEIRNQYRQMDDFFSNSFSSYCDFINQSRNIIRELSCSTYEGVRKLWQTLYEKERNRLLDPLMESITESNFETFFKNQARSLCENEFNLWDIESIDQVSLSTPTLVNDGTAKKSYGEYRIHLRGKLFGTPETARISIEGTIGVDESCNINAVRTAYQFLEKPIVRL